MGVHSLGARLILSNQIQRLKNPPKDSLKPNAVAFFETQLIELSSSLLNVTSHLNDLTTHLSENFLLNSQ